MDTLDGVSDEEKQTAVAIWAMANSTMYLCGDLAKFNNFAKTAFKMMSSSLSIPFGHFTQQITVRLEQSWLQQHNVCARCMEPHRPRSVDCRLCYNHSWTRLTPVESHVPRRGLYADGPDLRDLNPNPQRLNRCLAVLWLLGSAKLNYLGASLTTNNATFNVYGQKADLRIAWK